MCVCVCVGVCVCVCVCVCVLHAKEPDQAEYLSPSEQCCGKLSLGIDKAHICIRGLLVGGTDSL